MGGKKDILDSRFNAYLEDGTHLAMIPRVNDGQLLFMLNNVAKMKTDTPLGSRIAEVHNGSSLFTGDAGSGESNARRYLIENDLVEAIIALPENMFYNTNLATYIWVLSNHKEDRRKGKIQLIDASNIKSTLKKNMGKKNCEISSDLRATILEFFTNMEQNEQSVIVHNYDFGYWKVPVLSPKRDNEGNPVLDAKGQFVPDKRKTTYENIPFNYPGGIDSYLQNEVLPFLKDAWFDKKKIKIGYEIRFTRYFKPKIESTDINNIIQQIDTLQRYMQLPINLANSNPYSEYRSVDEIWISSVPAHWETIKIKYLFDERVEKGYPDEPLLAATQNMGVVPKNVYGQRTVEATKDLHLLKLVKVDDFVISLRSFQGGIERAYYQGIISPAYTIMIPKGISVAYFKHLAKSKVFIELLKQCVTGIREGQNVDYEMLKSVRIPVPPICEQLQIAKFLDSIDARIDARKKEIKLLEKYKATISSDIVIGQIDVRDVEVPDFHLVTEIIDENIESTDEMEVE